MKWRCWQPDHGQTRGDAMDVLGSDAREAAEEYARSEFHAGDPFQQITVRVAEWGSGNSSEVDVDVTVEVCPEFSASKPRPVQS